MVHNFHGIYSVVHCFKANRWRNNGNSDRPFSRAPKSLWTVTAAMKLRQLLLGRRAITNLDCVKKQRHHFANKGPSSQSYGFSSSHVWMWELDHKEGWAPKNWCFWTVVLDWLSVNSEGNQSWIFFRRTDTEAETPILWPPHAESWLIWKDPDAGKDWG